MNTTKWLNEMYKTFKIDEENSNPIEDLKMCEKLILKAIMEGDHPHGLTPYLFRQFLYGRFTANELWAKILKSQQLSRILEQRERYYDEMEKYIEERKRAEESGDQEKAKEARRMEELSTASAQALTKALEYMNAPVRYVVSYDQSKVSYYIDVDSVV